MKKSKLKKIALIISIFTIALISAFLCYFCYLYNSYSLDKEKLTSLSNGIRVFSSSEANETMYNTNRSVIDIETLPDYVVNAFIDTEDKRFYSHNGYDLARIFKAIMVNFFSQSKSQGASTISQQLIKNALLSNEKTYSRKMKEIVLSIKMEKQFSKDEILEMYLNTIYFGSNAYGIENASRIYFNKSAKDLTLNEACCLAGIIKSPNYYSPKTNYKNSIDRKNLVAKLMFNNNSISSDDYTAVINEEIVLNQNSIDTSYEQEAIYEACELLNLSERDLINNNYSIKTYKDEELQQEVLKSNSDQINLAKASSNSNLDSLTVVANNDGHILSFFSNSNYSLHNLKRQPASTLKPFAVYLPCIIHNILTPSTEILDEKINYNGFSPENADKKYNGYVSARYALSNSLNIPAVKALDSVGIKKSRDVLNKLGILVNSTDMNLSLALGATSKGIKILDLINAYITIANMGTIHNLTFIDKIYDKNNNVIYSNENYAEKIFNDEDCYLLTSMLKDTATTGTAKRLNSLNLPLASKTGTASIDGNNTDLYNITYSSKHTLLTWVANIKDKFLPNSLHSSSTPTDINKAICDYLYSDKHLEDFIKPDNVIYCAYDAKEQQTNHRIVAPLTNLERYKKYDYFKTSNQPEVINPSASVDLSVNVSNKGAELSFYGNINRTYEIYRRINNNYDLFSCVNDQNGPIMIYDNSIYNYDEIEYLIKNERNEIISNIVKIKPKDYLINEIENNVFSKRKWSV